MSGFTLTKTRFHDGTWEGLLSAEPGNERLPEVVAEMEDRPLHGVVVSDTPDSGRWVVEIPIPREALGDGVRTVLIRDARDNEILNSVTLVAGESLSEDIRAEMALLRAELDMLKRAFREHCRNTA